MKITLRRALVAAATLAAVFGIGIAAQADQTTDKIKSTLQSRIGDADIKSVQKSPVPGLYEVNLGAQIVKEAADNATKVQYTRIEVNGYTDTSGTPQYNQGLSIRRAQAVAGELVRDGVPKAAINIQGFGDTHLLVSTGPGVREPQNRRVEIIIR